jgi:hypothetical protein
MAKEAHYQDGGCFTLEAVNQALTFYVKSVQPSGTEGNDPINVTTNEQGSLETMVAPKRGTKTPMTAVVSYDFTDLASYEAAVNTSDDWLVKYDNDETSAPQAGWLRSIIPDNAEQAAQPTATAVWEFEGQAFTA